MFIKLIEKIKIKLRVACSLQPNGKQHNMRDFKKLMIWQLGMDIVDKVYEVVPHLPHEEKYGLRSQMTRSSSSIPPNIAEGSAKRSVKEYIRYVEISQGSAFELETHTLVVSRRKWVSAELINELLDMVRQEQKMISKFIDKLDGERKQLAA